MKIWQSKGLIAWLLWPFSLLYWVITFTRRHCYQWGIFTSYQAPVPVIVIGNISVGGTGKTPLVIALTKAMQQQGFTVGIVSRGYKSNADHYPYVLTNSSSSDAAGDEPLLIFQATQAPVVIDSDRPRAIQKLLATTNCDLILSDDGLQHYAMDRALEIAVIDGDKRLGNGWLLPAGPLREHPQRLKEVDIIVANGKAKTNEVLMLLEPTNIYALNDRTHIETLSNFIGQPVNAIAGIGNPDRFFKMLEKLGIEVRIKKALPDHHEYLGDEFSFSNDFPILTTEKDAVKCSSVKSEKVWVVPVEAVLPNSFYKAITQLVK